MHCNSSYVMLTAPILGVNRISDCSMQCATGQETLHRMTAHANKHLHINVVLRIDLYDFCQVST